VATPFFTTERPQYQILATEEVSPRRRALGRVRQPLPEICLKPTEYQWNNSVSKLRWSLPTDTILFVTPSVYTDELMLSIYTDWITDGIYRIKKKQFDDVESANMRWKSRVNKTWRLFHVDFFNKNTIEKCIMDIKLMNISFNYTKPQCRRLIRRWPA